MGSPILNKLPNNLKAIRAKWDQQENFPADSMRPDSKLISRDISQRLCEVSGMLREKLDQAWMLRFSQRIDECTNLVRQCKTELSRSSSENSADDFAAVDLMLLEASLSRARRDISDSDRLLNEAKDLLVLEKKSLPFQYSLQSGLNFYLKGDYTKALDHFLTASGASLSSLEKAWALSNILFCMEALGLPGAQVFHEFRTLLGDLDTQVKSDQFLTALYSYELRALFRAASFSAVLLRDLGSDTLRQEHYYQLWVSGLPYHSCKKEMGDLRERFYLASPWLHQKSYRIRTLQVQLHADDLNDFKASEFADRLYYWVWQWLSDPRNGLVDRILELVRSVDLNELAQRLTVEDFQMVRNSLQWLSLFDPASFGFVHKIIQILQLPFSHDYSIFEFERLAIEYLVSLRDGGDSRKLFDHLQQTPLWESTEFLLPSLLREISFRDQGSRELMHTRLEKLKENLIQIVYPKDDVSDFGLYVDLSSWIVRATAEKKRIISEPMCLAFQLLKSQGNASFEKFLHVSFGIARYESEIHDAKIFNLLSRMRSFAPPQLSLNTKAGRVYASGSWIGVTFINRPSDAKSELSQLGWKRLLENKVAKAKPIERTERWEKPVSAISQLQHGREISREELEKIMGKSRSTANRLIAQWVEQGRLKKTGSAKNTRYVFVKKKP